MAYAEDLKSSGAKAPCGFESRPRHQNFPPQTAYPIDDWRRTGLDRDTQEL